MAIGQPTLRAYVSTLTCEYGCVCTRVLLCRRMHTHYPRTCLSVGAQDFLPDFVRVGRWYSIYGIYPKYRDLSTATSRAHQWLQTARVSNTRSDINLTDTDKKTSDVLLT